MNKYLLTAFLALVMLGGLKAHAADYHDLVCIHNDTARTLYFSYKWGDGSWKKVSVEAGGWRSMWWNYSYANEWWSPKLSIQFDADLSTDTYWQTYTLEPYATVGTGCYEGHQYRFDYDGYPYIDLFDDE